MESSPATRPLFEHSPFLTHLAERHPALLRDIQTLGPDTCFNRLLASLAEASPHQLSIPALMKLLRHAKAETALIAACGDLSGAWVLEQVTGCLSKFAQSAIALVVDTLLAAAATRHEIVLPNPEHPSQGSGIIVLGMGKLGAFELNYSSDIDLIVFYERGALQYAGKATEQKFMNKLCHDLVQVMQERTADGYVFRTDLRLRPDPASTPPAVSTEAALYYYESVGQNWERAAMIKARALAGDIAAGEEFLRSIVPFIWRRSLDFAAIQDIHSIKRQMDTRTGREIQLAGHNIKLGPGGIREIEFFVQIHQLIWGGKQPHLRLRGTCAALAELAAMGLVEADTADMLTHAYDLLRKIEHRLQMIADQQTHSLPADEAELTRIAEFSGYETLEDFAEELLATLAKVHAVFSAAFQSSEVLGDEGNLVFTGVSHDPDTLTTLEKMGYTNATAISETVMGWHHGSRRATRTKRAREQLTELMPILLKRLSQTASPDAAFLKFDEFLNRVPAGVQLFALFTAYPQLLDLIADVMGSAPALAESLSKHPDLLESVLYGDFYGTLPTRETLLSQMDAMLASAEDFDERMEALRRFKNERQFQAGVQLLRGSLDARSSGAFLSLLADVVLARTVEVVQDEFARAYGRIPGGSFCVIGMGRLGSEEMTFGSDIDLVFVYDATDDSALSDGEKGFSASVYYNRLTQRLLSALTQLGKEGRLYETDTRLRPSGTQGLPAVSIEAFTRYFDEMAWTFEFMALTKARPVAGTPALMLRLERLIAEQLARPRELTALRADVADMRERVRREIPARDIWNVKYAPGGLMDIDFICQYLVLAHAHTHPEIAQRSSEKTLRQLHACGILPAESTVTLLRSYTFLTQLLGIMRLSVPGRVEEALALPGLKKLLADSVSAPDFAALKAELVEVENAAHAQYAAMFPTS